MKKDESPILTIPPVTSANPPATKTEDSSVKAEAKVEVYASRKEECLALMNKIEAEAGGISNIGMTSNYWDLLREYRTL